MTWNYRVMLREDFPEVTPVYGIHEVYYDKDGKPVSYAERPACVVWDGEQYGRDVLDMMRKAFDLPVLTDKNFQ